MGTELSVLTRDQQPGHKADRDPAFLALVRKTHKRAIGLRTEISRVELCQPQWDSVQMRNLLSETLRQLDASHEFNYGNLLSLAHLSCKTPLLDIKLVESANDLFHTPSQWFYAHKDYCIWWGRSGNDFSGLIPDLPNGFRKLQDRLAKAKANNECDHIEQMQSLFAECSSEFNAGDTQKAAEQGWSLVMLAEDTADYGIVADIVYWYRWYLDLMLWRPNRDVYRARLPSIEREDTCLRNDLDFVSTLSSAKNICNPKIVENLHAMHRDIIKRRFAGETEALKPLYDRFVALAERSEDRSGAIQYFALKAYHSFLTTDHRSTKNYDELRNQLYDKWVAEELGKQKSIAEANMVDGGDWKQLEIALETVEKNSILVCRDMQLCHIWGESHPAMLLTKARQPVTGLIYYQPPGTNDEDICLVCRGLVNQDCEELGLPSIVTDLRRCLSDAGFKPIAVDDRTTRITGNWTRRSAKKLSLRLLDEVDLTARPVGQ